MIRFDGVWKSYPRWPTGARTLRAMAARRMPLFARRGERTWALRDVSVAVAPGRSVGLIGRNGAGKSTMLRLASGLGRPTRGSVLVDGETASVLTLADTFAPNLSGRENALTAAIVAGFRRAQARALLPAVLDFAELEEFADAPTRTYSDGMRLRLAFGVVSQLRPQALLLDEVIAVGDLTFQAKCMEWVREIREAGAALLLASHDLGLIERECDEAMWLEDGRVMTFGQVAEVVHGYEQAMRERTLSRTPAPSASDGSDLELGRNRVGTQRVTIASVTVVGEERPGSVESGGGLRVSLELRSHVGPVLDPIIAIAIHRERDRVVCFDTNTRDEAITVGRLAEATVTLQLARLDLLPGRYVLDVGLYRSDWDEVYDFHWHAYGLEVTGKAPERGILLPPHTWSVRRR